VNSLKSKEIDTYRKIKISGMNQQELIVFLYESSLQLIEEAKETIAARDVPATHDKLNRARNIFVHLLATLNLEAGGEFALRLSSLYAFFVEKITMANVTKNVQELDDIVPIITNIKEAWAGMKWENESNSKSGKLIDLPQLVSMEV
jgi:flagellar secretion chaperone FliS